MVLNTKILCSKSFHLPGRANRKGKIACEKRDIERVCPEIKSTMNRLTNHYNLAERSEILLALREHVWGVTCYVVRDIPNCSKHPAIINRLTKVGSKVDNRRVVSEFEISRKSKDWGRRRMHSTARSCGKGSSHSSLKKY
jgi:hypothetical protein